MERVGSGEVREAAYETTIASAEPGGVELVRRAGRQAGYSRVRADHPDPQAGPHLRAARPHRPDQARSRRACPRLLLAGTALTVAGVALPSGLAFIAGLLILLRAVAVSLGVSEPRRGADFFGFGSQPHPGPAGQNRT